MGLRYAKKARQTWLRKNEPELLELSEACWGVELSRLEGSLPRLKDALSSILRRLTPKHKKQGAYSCSFQVSHPPILVLIRKSTNEGPFEKQCARVFNFPPSLESINAHILMHIRRQHFFKCTQCDRQLRFTSTLHLQRISTINGSI